MSPKINPIHSPDLKGVAALVAVKTKRATGIGYPLREIRKAIVGGLVGAGPLFAVDILDLHISRGEAGGLAGAFVVGVLAVFHIRNANPPAEGGE